LKKLAVFQAVYFLQILMTRFYTEPESNIGQRIAPSNGFNRIRFIILPDNGTMDSFRNILGFEVLTEVVMNYIFWDIIPCSLLKID
jgi:hypothetical protein